MWKKCALKLAKNLFFRQFHLKVFFKITGTDFLRRYNLSNFYSFSLIFWQFVETSEHSIILNFKVIILKGSWRKMKKKIFNFFPGQFETIKSIPLRSPIFRKLKYVPMSGFEGLGRDLWANMCGWFEKKSHINIFQNIKIRR